MNIPVFPVAAPRLFAASAMLLLTLAGAVPASAQLAGKPIIPLGGANLGGPVQGMDSGYDPVNHVHLVVSAYLNAWGWFVNSDGAPVAGPFLIKQGGGGSFAPRVKYSPHVNNGQGGFLVTYAEEGARNQNILHGRIISFPGVMGPETTISEGTAFPWIISGSTALSYSPASQVFLVAWMTTGPGLPLVARTVGLSGAPVGPVMRLSTEVGLYPGVAWNSITNRFGVSFRDEGSVGYSGFAVVSPASTIDASQRFQPVAGQQGATDVDFNPYTGRFVMAWFAQPGGGAWEARSAEMDGSANMLNSGLVYSRGGGIGFSSLSLAHNPVSGTFLAATLETIGALDPVLGFELNQYGVRFDSSHVGSGVLARNVRVSTNTAAAAWHVAFNHDTRTALSLVVNTGTRGGGPGGSYSSGGGATPPPPPAPTPQPTACPTVQPAPDWVCVNGGWLPPGMGGVPAPPPPPPAPAPPAPSANCPTVQPAPDWVCVNGGWLPPGMGGVPAPAPPAPAPPTPAPPVSNTCPSVKPAADWVCVSGNWLPPGLAPAAPAPAPPPPSSASCSTVQPAPDWICISGNWLPPGLACPTVQPGPGWTCRSGDWLPPGMVFNRPLDLERIGLPGLSLQRLPFVVAARATRIAAPQGRA